MSDFPFVRVSETTKGFLLILLKLILQSWIKAVICVLKEKFSYLCCSSFFPLWNEWLTLSLDWREMPIWTNKRRRSRKNPWWFPPSKIPKFCHKSFYATFFKNKMKQRSFTYGRYTSRKKIWLIIFFCQKHENKMA